MRELRALVALPSPPHVICISETWFDDESAPGISGYDIFRRDRPSFGGGVVIYSKVELRASVVANDVLQSDNVEQIWCSILTGKERILVGCVYRPPRLVACSDDALLISIKTAKNLVELKAFDSFLLAGDFNLGEISWTSDGVGSTSKSESSLEDRFLELIDDCFLSQCISEPTFYNGADDSIGSVLDLILTDRQERILEVIYSAPLGAINKAHVGISWKFAVGHSIPEVFRERKDWNKGKYALMNEELRSIYWEKLLLNRNLDTFNDHFVEIYHEMCNKFIPPRKNNNRQVPWMNSELKSLINEKHRLWYRYKSSRSAEHLHEEYRRFSAKVRKEIKLSVTRYESKLAAKSKRDPKVVYAYAKSMNSVKDHIRALVDKDGLLVTNRVQVADVLNSQFQSVFVVEPPKELDKLPEFSSRRSECFGISDLTDWISLEAIKKRLSSLCPSKSCGYDEIHPYVLKTCAAEFARPLRLIFQRSLTEGHVPSTWKLANVSPIFKKGSRVTASNYRPVSLTSVVCKVMERIVRDALMRYLESEGLIAKEQHGFVNKKSCTSNLLETLDLVTKELSEGNSVEVVYLDFLKAFDMVPHRRLLLKLKGYGLKDDLLKWLESFLSGRKQRVVLGETASDWVEVTSGVPQGSVLGPLLFVIYINDLPEKLINHSKLFADDSKIIAILNSLLNNVLQNDIDAVTHWTSEWLMRLNALKCKIVHFGKPQEDCIGYTIEDLSVGSRVPLEVSCCERDLGVYVSSDLKWSKHVQMIASRANRVLGMLVRTFTSRDVSLWKTLYVSLVRPHLEFASSVWNPYLKGDIKMIEKVQRRATKIPSQMRDLPYDKRLSMWGLTALDDRRVRGDLIQMFKFTNGYELIDWYTGPQLAPSSQTRAASSNNQRLVRESFLAKASNDHGHFVSTRHNFFLNRVAGSWNGLNNFQIQAPSLNSFKARVDSTPVKAAIA